MKKAQDVKTKKGILGAFAREGRYFKRNSELTLLALPMVIMIFIFNYIPLYGLVLPFKDYKVNLGFLKSPWAGIENFKYLFTGEDILRATKNTVLYNLVFLAGVTICGLIVALMLFQLSRRAVKTYQTVFFMPYFFSWVVVSYVVLSVFDMKYGVANKILTLLGKPGIMWYNEPKYWPFILVFMHLWKNVGYRALVYYAALMNVDMTLYEAADLDGATGLQKITNVAIPAIMNLIVMMLIMDFGHVMSGDFGLFYNVPLNSSLLYSTTDIINTYVYRGLMQLGDIGMSSAATLYQSVVGFILVMLANYVTRKVSEENALF